MNLITVGGGLVHTQPLSESLIEKFIAFADVSERSMETYKNALRQLFRFFSFVGVTSPTREDVISFRDELKKAHKASTVANYMVAVKLFFCFTEQQGIYPNITNRLKSGVKIGKEKKRDYLTTEQLRSVIQTIATDSLVGLRNHALFALMACCSLRCVEVMRADIADMRNVGNHTVLFVQGKGQSEKSNFVIIPPSVEVLIRQYLAKRGITDAKSPLFCSTSNNNAGQRMTTRSISGIIKGILRGAGFDSETLTAHSLRHSGISACIASNEMTLIDTQQYARHAEISNTMIYVHQDNAHKNRGSQLVAAAILE